MNTSHFLTLYEEILLLALKDKAGTVFATVNYHFAIGGALIAELLLRENIRIETKRRSKYVELIDGRKSGDPILDECINKIKSAKHRSKIETWINRFSGIKNLKHRIAEKLCQRGILHNDQDTLLLIFKRTIYPEINPEPEKMIIQNLQAAIFEDTDDIAVRTIVLLSLAKHTNLLQVIFDKKDLKTRKERIDKLINGEISGQATKEAVEAMQAAVMVACIMPAVLSATVTSS
jgi:hypothetical protein